MKIKKEVLRSIKPQGCFNATNLINNVDKMNARIEKTIKLNEEKISRGKQRILRKDYGKIK